MLKRAHSRPISIVLMVVILVAMARWQIVNYPPVPFRMAIVSSGTRKGLAAVDCDAFTVAFEGKEAPDKFIDVTIPIDGRYGLFSSPWKHLATTSQLGPDVQLNYSQSTRTLTILAHGHTLEYCEYQHVLKVDRTPIDLPPGHVDIEVKSDGQVVQG